MTNLNSNLAKDIFTAKSAKDATPTTETLSHGGPRRRIGKENKNQKAKSKPHHRGRGEKSRTLRILSRFVEVFLVTNSDVI